MSHYLGQDRQGRPGRRPAARLTGRGAVVLMLGTFTLGMLLEAWLHQPLVAGVAYLGGAVAAARYTKPAALLIIAASPPLLFLVALVAVMSVTSGSTLSAVGGAAFALAGTAPWLFAGTVIALIVAWFRGLPACIRDLRRELREPEPAPAPRGPSAPGPGRGPAPRRR